MTGVTSRVTLAVTLAALAFSAPAALSQSEPRFYVTHVASTLVDDGLATAAPAGAEAAAFETVPAPGVQLRPDEARATSTPWIDSNVWRFQRGTQKVHYASLPEGAAPLAAAEAFVFDVNAVLDPDPADVEELRQMLRFLAAEDRPRLPVMANIGVVDHPSPLFSEVLNLLSRRNLLYRVVPAPDPALDLTVRLGTEDFPLEAAADPSAFAARVRTRLGDDKRLVRLYGGASTVIAHLTGERARARLYLLNYGRTREPRGAGNPQAIRVRVLGRYQPTRFTGYRAAPQAMLTDIEHPEGATTEFWVPDFATLAIIDLDPMK
ncbi:hypothetical protein BH23ACI1_BH23ACI1_21140 [soil metagenome]